MKLRDFLRTKTNALELCVITDAGWIVATFWIDHEDLFCRHLDKKLGECEVKSDKWDYLTVVNENNDRIKIPCHYVDL